MKFQGQISFDSVPFLQGKGITAEVGGPQDPNNNYVVADTNGITLTGLSVTKALPSDLKLGGMEVSGRITFGYKHENDEHDFSISGQVSLSSETQGIGQSNALKDVAAGLDFTVTNGAAAEFSFTLGGAFKIFDLQVATLPNKSLSFTYDFEQHRYEIGGGLSLQFNDNEIEVDLVGDNNQGPGIIIENGQLTLLQATVSADFTLFGAQVTSPGVTWT